MKSALHWALVVCSMLRITSFGLAKFRSPCHLLSSKHIGSVHYGKHSRLRGMIRSLGYFPMVQGGDDVGGNNEVPSSAQKRRKIVLRKLSTKRSVERKERDIDVASEAAVKPSNWVTYEFATEEEKLNAEMEERLMDAERWVSKKLSDEEADILNRAMGIEAEVMSALEADEDEGRSKPRKAKKSASESGRDSNASKGVRKLKELSSEASKAALEVKGFLELNPYLCSGCGTPFQSSSEENPGYLPKEKMQAHKLKAEMIKEKQRAIRTLDLAGIDVDSDDAVLVLQQAKVSPEVIAGVRALGQSQRARFEAAQKYRDAEDTFNASRDTERGGGGRETLEERDALPVVDGGRQVKSAGTADKGKATTKSRNEATEESDPLDGLEFSLDDFMAAMGSNKDGSELSVSSALIDTIQKESLKRTAQSKSTPPIDLVNDIDGEINHQKVTASASSTESSVVEKNAHLDTAAAAEDGVKADESTNDDTSSLLYEPLCICQRCFRLQQHNQVVNNLRPGWSENDLLTPERFEELLGAIKENKAVVLCLVDVFDLQGSILPNLKQIAGKNPIVIAVNKADLLPEDASQIRITTWIHTEIKRICNLQSPRELKELERQDYAKKGWSAINLEKEIGVLRRENVHLVSCATGMGMAELLTSVLQMAESHGQKIYVMGAANVGKSSFINRLLDTSYGLPSAKLKRKGGKRPRDDVPQATVSNLPGTTLDFLKIRLPNGITMIDTPGLLKTGQLTAKLNTAELGQVIPSKPIKPITLRVLEKKVVLIGGLASVELLEVRNKLGLK